MSIELLDYRFVTQHRGRDCEFLDRYELAAGGACQGRRKHYDDFCGDLLRYASDDRNLAAAVRHLRHNGGTAPGPDGLRLSDYSQIELWAAVRELRDQLLDGGYQRGPLRRCQIQKHPGSREKRSIYLAGVLDRIVTRGATQSLTPLLEPVADPLSFCRRRKGRQIALAFVKRLAEEGRYEWIIEDARSAFDRVPRSRMLQILRRYIPNDAFCQLVMQLVEPPNITGILQGSSLSMLLLDLYLTHLVHRPWRKESLPPLARYADDCLIALQLGEDVPDVYERLTHHFHSAGMEAKHGYDKAVVDLRYRTAQWLGYHLRWRRGRLEIRWKLFDISNEEQAQQTHEQIFSKFARLHERDQGWRYQNSLLRGMIANLAPTLPFANPDEIYGRIVAAARDAGFEELWSLPQVLERWQADYKRWLWVCEHVNELVFGPDTRAREEEILEFCQAGAIYDPSVPPWE